MPWGECIQRPKEGRRLVCLGGGRKCWCLDRGFSSEQEEMSVKDNRGQAVPDFCATLRDLDLTLWAIRENDQGFQAWIRHNQIYTREK